MPLGQAGASGSTHDVIGVVNDITDMRHGLLDDIDHHKIVGLQIARFVHGGNLNSDDGGQGHW